jgi:hypothetical protein
VDGARVTAGELDGWLRSMVTMGNVDSADVRRVLESHKQLLAQQRELKATLDRLAPAFAELRGILNELNRRLE